MRYKQINLFMWAYQHAFRVAVKLRMNNVMEVLGVSKAGAECLLVGVKIPDHQNRNDVCVEPEDGKWPISLFDGLPDLIQAEITAHPWQNLLYSDAPSRRDHPENIRRDSIRRAVQQALASYDSDHGVQSFAGAPAPVEDHYVVPILQLPGVLFERFPPLRMPVSDDDHDDYFTFTGPASLVHAAISEVLAVAHDALFQPDPGRNWCPRWPSAEEIGRRAAASFMYTPRVAIGDKSYYSSDLFERVNLISSLMYEGTKGMGRLLLAQPDSGAVNMSLKFAAPVPFHEPRWSRKVLQMASDRLALVADGEQIFGLGNLAADGDPWTSQDVFEIKFLDHHHWRLSCGDRIMLISKYGIPTLPQEAFSRARLLDTYQRLFPKTDQEDADRFFALYRAADDQHHGSMLVVAQDAESEADRLRGQGTRIEPTKLTPALYGQVSGIDGAVIVDPHGVCHAIGVILDGPARPECTPSRGARYNSGIRYVGAANTPRLAVIVSDDQTTDVIPVLRPRIQRSAIDKAIAELEAATSDNYHPAIRWLDRHRFYLGPGQCDRINAALERIQNEPIEVGEIRIQRPKFSPDPDLDDSYFESEDAGSTSA